MLKILWWNFKNLEHNAWNIQEKSTRVLNAHDACGLWIDFFCRQYIFIKGSPRLRLFWPGLWRRQGTGVFLFQVLGVIFKLWPKYLIFTSDTTVVHILQQYILSNFAICQILKCFAFFCSLVVAIIQSWEIYQTVLI